MTSTLLSTDFVISGGGLVGALLALLLERQGFDIALIEAQKRPPPNPEKALDTRMLALNYGTITLLKNWGFLPLLKKLRFIHKIHVSDKGHPGIVHIDAADEKLPYLGGVIPFEELSFNLQQQATKCPGIHFFESKIESFHDTCEQVDVSLENGAKLKSKILISCEGSESCIRKTLGIQMDEHDYKTFALIGQVEVKKQVSDAAFERFTPEGPIALLPTGERHYTMIWVRASDSMPENLLASLQEVFGYRAGIFISHGPMRPYPLKNSLAKESYQGRVGLLGNAAHTLHPVAAQGFNLSVRDILTFLEALKMADSLTPALFARFSEMSRYQQKFVQTLTHTLVKGFETRNPLIKAGRTFLLQFFEFNNESRTFLNDLMIGRY